MPINGPTMSLRCQSLRMKGFRANRPLVWTRTLSKNPQARMARGAQRCSPRSRHTGSQGWLKRSNAAASHSGGNIVKPPVRITKLQVRWLIDAATFVGIVVMSLLVGSWLGDTAAEHEMYAMIFVIGAILWMTMRINQRMERLDRFLDKVADMKRQVQDHRER